MIAQGFGLHQVSRISIRLCETKVLISFASMSSFNNKMTTQEIRKEIITLYKVLEECILTSSQRVSIKNEIGELQDELIKREHID
jgi:hypothetical protein